MAKKEKVKGDAEAKARQKELAQQQAQADESRDNFTVEAGVAVPVHSKGLYE